MTTKTAELIALRKLAAEKFFSRIEKTNGCWIWLGAKTSEGYGSVRFDGQTQGAHRISYKLLKGPIAKNMMICHTCDNPQCVNPDHLYAGTAPCPRTWCRPWARAGTPPRRSLWSPRSSCRSASSLPGRVCPSLGWRWLNWWFSSLNELPQPRHTVQVNLCPLQGRKTNRALFKALIWRGRWATTGAFFLFHGSHCKLFYESQKIPCKFVFVESQ